MLNTHQIPPNRGSIRIETEKRQVRFGIGKLDEPMTMAQAKRYGDREMPRDLKKAGFETFVSASDQELHGGLWFRIDYGKTTPAH